MQVARKPDPKINYLYEVENLRPKQGKTGKTGKKIAQKNGASPGICRVSAAKKILA
jgi:hypothetical protein